MDFDMFTGSLSCENCKGTYSAENVCLRRLHGCMLDFTHVMLKAVKKLFDSLLVLNINLETYIR